VSRIEVIYEGEMFTIGGRELADVQADVAAALEAGHGWLEVNQGSGAPATTHLLLSRGVPLALGVTKDPP
jgi:hypothetical protein